MSSDMIMRRLSSLKQLSAELKESTQNSNEINYQLIKSLLSSAKNIYGNDLYEKNTNIQKILKKNSVKNVSFDSNSHRNVPFESKSHRNGLFESNSQHRNGLFESNSQHRNETFAHKTYSMIVDNQQEEEQVQEILNRHESDLHDEQELISLREENIKLEGHIQMLQKENVRLTEDKNKFEELSRKSTIPFFQLSQPIDAFICRLIIKAEDYNRVDYLSYQVTLHLDKITLYKKEKAYLQQFQLSNLIQVEYISQASVVLFRFKEQSENMQEDIISNVFLKFGNSQLMHRWDLGLFANYNIINSINKDKLFQQTFKKKQQHEKEKQSNEDKEQKEDKQYKEDKELRENKEHSDKDLMKLLLLKRDQYLQVRKLINQKLIEKIQHSKDNKNAGSEVDFEKEMHEGSLNQNLKRQKKQEIKPMIAEDHAMNKKVMEVEASEKQARKKEIEISERKKEEEKRKVVRAKDNLQHGYNLTKYSKDGFNPHDKRVFLSIDEKKLCWSQIGKVDYKSIQLTSIITVNYQQIGEGITKHVKNPIKSQYCIIQYSLDKEKTKFIELGHQDQNKTQSFASQLTIFLEAKVNKNKVISNVSHQKEV